MEVKNKKLTAAIHVHSWHSRKDAIATVEKLVERIFELGGSGIALTDHGVMSGFEDLRQAVNKYNGIIDACSKKNCEKCLYGKACSAVAECKFRKYAEPYVSSGTHIKGIPGVEAYFEDESIFTKRAHLILLPKDNIGFRELSKAVTEASTNLDSQDFPLMNFESIEKYFGVGTVGHGHVLALSACVIGVISSVLLNNYYINKQIEKNEKKMMVLPSPDAPEYIADMKVVRETPDCVVRISEQIKILDKISKKPYTKKLKTLASLEGYPEYNELKARLDDEMSESKNALVQVKELRDERARLQQIAREAKERVDKNSTKYKKYNNLAEETKILRSNILSDNEIVDRATEQAKKFDKIFGHGNFFAELQYHGMDIEKMAMPNVAKIAALLDLPVVATNDAHTVTNSEDELKTRQLMRAIRFYKWEEITEGDKQLYIKTDEELANALTEILSKDTVERAMSGIKEVIDSCNVSYNGETHYPKFPAEVPGESADAALRRKAENGINWRYPDKKGWTAEHETRMNYELSVIAKMGYSDYLCIVQDFLEYGRIIGKLNLSAEEFLSNPFDKKYLSELAKESVGEGIGPGRGSAVGSLVCYLTGITNVDPMKYNLIFERFLNIERVSMPDIDSDFAPLVREWCVRYVKNKYGENNVCCIMTKGTQQAKAAIRNAARLLGVERADDKKCYAALGDVIAKAVPKQLNITLNDCWDELSAKFGSNSDAMEILNNAKLIEGMFTNVGMHAAGVIISDAHPVDEYIPLMYIPGKGQMASQCDKDQCEGRGMLKMDFLGLKNLGVITETLKLIKTKTGEKIDIEQVPIESAVLRKIFAEGNTNSVFQFESSGMKQMLRQFQPSSIEDIILLVAAYRPGPMQYLSSIIEVKRGQRSPDYVIPEMESVLGQTYGYPVYQEQIMTIFNKFAGFSLGESDIIRRYMSKKKTEKFMAYKDKFIEGMIERGGDPKKVEDFWEQLLDFSRYAFNKSHAAAYAFVAYYTAWLKYHHTKEYLCAVLNSTDFEKINKIIGDCRAFGIKVHTPEINHSGSTFSVTDDGIIYGFTVKSVNEEASSIITEREANGEFSSVANFILRTRVGTNVSDALIKAGAFDVFSKSRMALLASLPDFYSILDKIKKKEKSIKEKMDSERYTEEKRTADLKLLDELKNSMEKVFVDKTMNDDILACLQKEKEVTGCYISSHPMNFYPKPKAIGCTQISELSAGKKCSVEGIISSLRITSRKSDGAKMAFFMLEDMTDSIEVCCFTNTYGDVKDLLIEDSAIKVTGKAIVSDDASDDGENNETLQFVLQSGEPVSRNDRYIKVYANSMDDWHKRILPVITKYEQPTGFALQVYVGDERKIIVTEYTVSSELSKNKEGIVVSCKQ